MSEDNNTPKKPSHHAFQVNEGQDGKSYFNRVGAAFEHKDGQGYNIMLDSVPVDGRVTLRTPQERLNDMRGDNQAQPEQKRQAETQAQPEAQAAPQQDKEVER